MLALLLLLTSTAALVVQERQPVPREWTRVGPAPAHDQLVLHIGLRQANSAALERHLARSSSILSKDETDELVRPSAEAFWAVEQWLAQHGVVDYTYASSARDWLTARVRVDTAERLLGTEYHVYRHEGDGDELVRAPVWSLPANVAPHVDTVQPTTVFLRRQARAPPSHADLAQADVQELGHIPVPDQADLPDAPSPAQACNPLAVSPLCLRALYGSLGYRPPAPAVGNSFAIVNFLDEVNNRSDVDLFLRAYRKDAARDKAAYRFTTETVAGGLDDQKPNPDLGYEGALDAQAALGVGHPTPLVAYNVGARPPPFRESAFTPRNRNEPYLAWLHHVLAQPPSTLPLVMSISYADEEQTVPPSYARRVCNAFAQLGARGVTVLVSSGDEGVGHAGNCSATQDGRPAFLPTFPASCPYVTAVGATRHVDPELVAFDARTGFVSGAGFSNYFARPAYQDAAVLPYVDTVLGPDKHAGMWNPRGRAVPDIAAAGYHYTIMWNGTARLTDGTSASAPTVAAIVALVNDALLAAGHAPLGFLNPWLYDKGWRGFTDIVHGNATGCGTDGFPAAPGWDAASGFGTPWFPRLKELAFELREQRRPWYYGDG
ncbi:uncharacterized protein K452DRAFT_231903 [Aplosporella prunicola CBS 121167]|uniref:tripeptidyl-peptidase II n=1 Tax=Aplosporella prunicola CBS 121167 TaxID=1176127 RepID=A0A6A6B974_9PEZI|nr:uncharacterized protein K452DRAFT_231903 [Aplosporella prunicola CBS 121167]KAF2139774.1 hypothetical protein K452DRAFT_231903 [Aplosporella prunicola CBS 121167]